MQWNISCSDIDIIVDFDTIMRSLTDTIVGVQSNLRRKDTLGAGLLSFVRRLSLSRRFTHISITSLFNVKKNSFIMVRRRAR